MHSELVHLGGTAGMFSFLMMLIGAKSDTEYSPHPELVHSIVNTIASITFYDISVTLKLLYPFLYLCFCINLCI